MLRDTELLQKLADVLEEIATTRDSFDFPNMARLKRRYNYAADMAILLDMPRYANLLRYEFAMIEQRIKHQDG